MLVEQFSKPGAPPIHGLTFDREVLFYNKIEVDAGIKLKSQSDQHEIQGGGYLIIIIIKLKSTQGYLEKGVSVWPWGPFRFCLGCRRGGQAKGSTPLEVCTTGPP